MTRTALPAALLALVACQPDAPAADAPASAPAGAVDAPSRFAVSTPFVAAAPAGGAGGVFLSVTAGPEPDTLVGARADVAERVELHETYDAGDGLRGMREVAAVPVAPGETVALAPGGAHVMLMNLARELAPGDTLDLELDFARAGAVPVRVPVIGLDALPAAAE